jgi:hypothetical protein
LSFSKGAQLIQSVCPECKGQNRWEKLYCDHCGASLKGAELVQQDKETGWANRLRFGGAWPLILVALILSLSGIMVALLSQLVL